MLSKFSQFSLRILAIFLLSFFSFPIYAIGPRTVANGNAVKWASMPVPIHIETGLNIRGKDVSPLIEDALSTWENLSDSKVTFQRDTLGVSVDDTNICQYFYDTSACPNTATLSDGKNPLVIDEDGQIVADFFGSGNRFTTLGFASIINYNTSSGAAIKGEAVFNAACLLGVEIMPGCSIAGGFSFTDADFTSFIVHEMGHFLGLDHSQVNLMEATDHDTSNDNLITTMFPTFIQGNGASFKVPKRDDQVGLAQLYPSDTFAASTWQIVGKVYTPDGTTEIQCANVVARNTSNPRIDAISALSGDFAPAGSGIGDVEILGLTPGETYTLDVEAIGKNFTGSSGYTPCRGSNGEPSPPSLIFDSIDDPTQASSLIFGSSGLTVYTAPQTFTGSAGQTVQLYYPIGKTWTPTPPPQAQSGSGGCSLLPF